MQQQKPMRKRPSNFAPRQRSNTPRASRAFTIIELLTVVGIVIVLLSIIIVAVNAAMRSSQRSSTQALMTQISTALTQFQSDIGYLPPVLDENRDYFEPPTPRNIDDAANFPTVFEETQDWWSVTSLPEYLLGYGDATEDGFGPNNWKLVADDATLDLATTDGALGIRHPGTDGYWGVGGSSGLGTLDARREALGPSGGNARYLQGRAYGPYIELRSDSLLAAVIELKDDGSFTMAFPGEANYDPDLPKAIVDYWGQPIRYYRKPYVPGMPNQDYRRGMYNRDGAKLDRAPTLSDVILLRPWQVAVGQEVDGVRDGLPFNPDDGDPTTSRTLQSANFGLFSSGPDRRLVKDKRVDADITAGDQEYNRDNIVELGR